MKNDGILSELPPDVRRRLAKQAKKNKRSIDAEAKFIIQTWIEENMQQSVEIAKQLGEQLGEGMVKALDQATMDFAEGRMDPVTVTVRVKDLKKARRGKRATRKGRQ